MVMLAPVIGSGTAPQLGQANTNVSLTENWSVVGG
jgi:hypothetical protein